MKKQGANGLPVGENFYWKRDRIYCEIWEGEKQIFHGSTRTADVSKALKFKAAKRKELIKAEDTTIADLKKGVRVSELLADYIARMERREADGGAYMDSRRYETPSYKASSRINKNLVPFFGRLKPEEMTSSLLADYKDKRRAHGAKVPTVNSEFRILRAALRRGIKTTPKKVNPIHIPDFGEVINDKAEKKAARTGTIGDQTFEKIMQHISAHLKPVFVAVQFTGIRSKEIKWVRRDQVNFETNTIELLADETKDGNPRVAPINDLVKPILLEWEAYTKEHYPKAKFFFHQDGAQLGNWKTAWNATLKRAGLRMKATNPDGTPKYKISKKTGKRVQVWINLVKFHDTRRTNITNNDIDGVSERDNMSVSGHQNPGMSRRYNQSRLAAERVRIAQNESLRAKGKLITEPATVAPVASVSDWKASLKELKETFELGLIPEDLYRTEVSRVMSTRKNTF